MSPFLDFECGRVSAVLVDNYEWISGLDVLSLLCDVGKHLSLGTMLAKEGAGAAPDGHFRHEFTYQVL